MITELHERGLAMRKKVLGAAQVEQTYAGVAAAEGSFRIAREAFAEMGLT